MSENGMLKITYKEQSFPIEMFIATPAQARADEYTALFHILKRYENRKGVDFDLAVGAEQLRPQLVALGITDITWEFV